MTSDAPLAAAAQTGEPTVVVACLCAAWCRQCDAYADVFRGVTGRLAAEWPALGVRWIDIEDEADLCGDLDIETFPTLLVCSGGAVRFAGALEPHAATLERVLRAALARAEAPAPVPQQAAFDALAARLNAG